MSYKLKQFYIATEAFVIKIKRFFKTESYVNLIAITSNLKTSFLSFSKLRIFFNFLKFHKINNKIN